MKVTKRNGDIVKFDSKKIENAIKNAFKSVKVEFKKHDVKSMVSDVKESLKNKAPHVENIQDEVEKELMKIGEFEVAKHYILYRDEHKKHRLTGYMPESSIQDYLFTSRYARYLPKEKRRETYNECVDRVKNMHIDKFPHKKDDIEWAFGMVKEKRVLPSMRSLQFAGKAIKQKNERIYNCSFSVADRKRFFQESIYMLLCGVGVGFSVEKEHVYKLPKLASEIDTNKLIHHTIDDSIEGWADAVGALVDSYINGSYVEFNYSKIRKRGEYLKTSGGKAPGHFPLKRSLEKVREILSKSLNRHLKPIEVYDIVMHLCDAVLAGGIRRSACICLFSVDDEEMINAKIGNWFEENPQRGRSNNSAKLIRNNVTKEQFSEIFEKQKAFGEPAFYFTENIDYGSNPCVEIGLNPFYTNEYGTKFSGWAFCNLSEINGAKIKSKEDFKIAVKAGAIIGTLQASYTDFPYIGKHTEEICKREPLLGVSITGMMDSPEYTFDEDLQREMAELAIEVNKNFAEEIGINQAPRVTCVKPAGSTSLILGTASGIHPRHAKNYFRRVQANTEDNVYKHFNGFNDSICEKSVWSANGTDDVINFCVKSPSDAIVKSDINALELLDKVKLTQSNWVKYGTAIPESSPKLYHNVSNTISVKEHEWDNVREFIWDNRDLFTGISMLSDFGDKQYKQAPHEEITTKEDIEKWNKYCENYTIVDYTTMKEEQDNTKVQETVACAGGSCQLR